MHHLRPSHLILHWRCQPHPHPQLPQRRPLWQWVVPPTPTAHGGCPGGPRGQTPTPAPWQLSMPSCGMPGCESPRVGGLQRGNGARGEAGGSTSTQQPHTPDAAHNVHSFFTSSATRSKDDMVTHPHSSRGGRGVFQIHQQCRAQSIQLRPDRVSLKPSSRDDQDTQPCSPVSQASCMGCSNRLPTVQPVVSGARGHQQSTQRPKERARKALLVVVRTQTSFAAKMDFVMSSYPTFTTAAAAAWIRGLSTLTALSHRKSSVGSSGGR